MPRFEAAPKGSVLNVPRYFEPFVNDCFHNAYATVLLHMGLDPHIILADYLSFLYDPQTEYIGVNYFHRYSTSVEFTEEELNTSLEFVYQPGTKVFEPSSFTQTNLRYQDKVQINMYIHEDQEVATSRLKELISDRQPVIAVVDLYHMPYHRAYQKEHGLHCVVITGYDEAEGCYELFDRYTLSSSDFDGKLPMNEVHAGRSSNNPVSNPMAGDFQRPIRNLWMEINVAPQFQITEAKIRSILAESCRRMYGETKILGHDCGFSRLEALRGRLQSKKATSLDDYHLYLYKTYYNMFFKYIARSRQRFKAFINKVQDYLPENLIAESSQLLTDSAKHWDIAANVSLKLGIAKKIELIDDLDRHLQSISNVERQAIDKFYAFCGK